MKALCLFLLTSNPVSAATPLRRSAARPVTVAFAAKQNCPGGKSYLAFQAGDMTHVSQRAKELSSASCALSTQVTNMLASGRWWDTNKACGSEPADVTNYFAGKNDAATYGKAFHQAARAAIDSKCRMLPNRKIWDACATEQSVRSNNVKSRFDVVCEDPESVDPQIVIDWTSPGQIVHHPEYAHLYPHTFMWEVFYPPPNEAAAPIGKVKGDVTMTENKDLGNGILGVRFDINHIVASKLKGRRVKAYLQLVHDGHIQTQYFSRIYDIATNVQSIEDLYTQFAYNTLRQPGASNTPFQYVVRFYDYEAERQVSVLPAKSFRLPVQKQAAAPATPSGGDLIPFKHTPAYAGGPMRCGVTLQWPIADPKAFPRFESNVDDGWGIRPAVYDNKGQASDDWPGLCGKEYEMSLCTLDVGGKESCGAARKIETPTLDKSKKPPEW